MCRVTTVGFGPLLALLLLLMLLLLLLWSLTCPVASVASVASVAWPALQGVAHASHGDALMVLRAATQRHRTRARPLRLEFTTCSGRCS